MIDERKADGSCTAMPDLSRPPRQTGSRSREHLHAREAPPSGGSDPAVPAARRGYEVEAPGGSARLWRRSNNTMQGSARGAVLMNSRSAVRAPPDGER